MTLSQGREKFLRTVAVVHFGTTAFGDPGPVCYQVTPRHLIVPVWPHMTTHNIPFQIGRKLESCIERDFAFRPVRHWNKDYPHVYLPDKATRRPVVSYVVHDYVLLHGADWQLPK